eukprot:gnl/Spiro4/23269_TR11500_c0_g1_i1.p1 gnl/Spiro4/23269_TR11500_c0_g1~~gnl/Spiro4/23269_TR11500_c0_g1_i1.p1  ORF type:complete len:338 (+),score=89.50 gnl/Spiro4/23269_TR11500_c0_g1_i1:40-1014(+)
MGFWTVLSILVVLFWCGCSAAEDPDLTRLRPRVFTPSCAVRQANPIVLFTGGGASSGKSHVKWMVAQSLAPTPFCNIDPDDIMVNMSAWTPGYCAAQKYHVNSSNIAAELFNEAVANGYNFIMDGTLSNVPPALAHFAAAFAANYTVHVAGVTRSIEYSARNAVKRGDAEGRYVPIGQLVGSHVWFTRCLPNLTAVANCTQLWDTSKSKSHPALIFNTCDNSTKIDWVRMGTFNEKMLATKASIYPTLTPAQQHVYDQIDACSAKPAPPPPNDPPHSHWLLITLVSIAAAVVIIATVWIVLYCRSKRATRQEGDREFVALPGRP